MIDSESTYINLAGVIESCSIRVKCHVGTRLRSIFLL